MNIKCQKINRMRRLRRHRRDSRPEHRKVASQERQRGEAFLIS